MSRIRPLRSKILLALAGITALFIAVIWSIQQWTILPSFRALEQREALSDIERAVEAVDNEIAGVDSFLGDWSGWDDTYRFMQDGYEEYLHSNLESNVFREDSFDFICFVGLDGKLHWRGGQMRDGTPAPVPELPAEAWPPEHPLLQGREIDESRRGILLTSQGPLLLASRPITDSARTAAPRGWLVMGRFLDPDRVKAIAHATRQELEVVQTGGALGESESEALARLRKGAPRDVHLVDDERLEASAFLPALAGSEGLLLRVGVERSIMARGRHALDFALFSTLASAALGFGVLFFLLQRMVVTPLSTLKRHAVRIGQSDDLTARCELGSDDEIGVLAREFDSMVARLAETRARMLGAAREGGMSEIATSVLHDVGNALQGLHASHGALARRLSDRKLEDLERVSKLLGEHAHELDRWLAQDPKGSKVAPFLLALSRSLSEEFGHMRGDAGALAAGLEHVSALVEAQQQHAGRRGALESIEPGELFDEALRLTQDGSAPEPRLVLEYGPSRMLRCERHKLLAILVNLLRNARQSLHEIAPRQGTIALRVEAAEDGRLRFVVADDGVGIEPEQLERIFAGGYTSKAAGHGLGLHTCANGAREMQGRLWAESDGRGKGARFVLELPLEARMEQEAAA